MIKKLIAKIMVLAVSKSQKTKSDIFVDFAAHINELQIRIYTNGWNKDKAEPDICIFIDLDVGKYLTEEDIIENLEKALDEIKGVKPNESI